MGNFTVSLKKLTEKVSMDVVYTPQDLENISVEIAEVNRPGLFLAGYYDYFDKLRLQIMGLAEMNFLAGLPEEKRRERLVKHEHQQNIKLSGSSRLLLSWAAVKNWSRFPRCWNWQKNTVWRCCAPMRRPAH